MTTIKLANEPKTDKPRDLEITVLGVNIETNIILKDTDGSVIMKAKPEHYNSMFPIFTRVGLVNPNQVAIDKLNSDIEAAYGVYYQTINS